jgi:hypothetical protein
VGAVAQIPRCPLASSVSLAQHPDSHRSKRPILLAVDQQLSEGAALPDSSSTHRSLSARSKKELGASCRWEGIQVLEQGLLHLI